MIKTDRTSNMSGWNATYEVFSVCIKAAFREILGKMLVELNSNSHFQFHVWLSYYTIRLWHLVLPVVVSTVTVSHGVSDSSAETLSQRIAVLHIRVEEHLSGEGEEYHRIDVDNEHCKRDDHLENGVTKFLVHKETWKGTCNTSL